MWEVRREVERSEEVVRREVVRREVVRREVVRSVGGGEECGRW